MTAVWRGVILSVLSLLSLARSDTCEETATSFIQLAPPTLSPAGQPRFCILDRPPPAEEFIIRFEDAVERHAIYDFIAVERDNPTTVLEGLDPYDASYSPTYPQMLKADIACTSVVVGCLNSSRKVAWSKVRTMWFNAYPCSSGQCNFTSVLEDPEAQASLDGTFMGRLIMGPADIPHLSEFSLSTVLGRGWFRYLFFSANDELDLLHWPPHSSPEKSTKIETLPQGLSLQYLRGRERALLDAAKAANLSAKRGILGAWDVRMGKTTLPGFARDRTDIDTWVNTSGSFVDRRSIDPMEYFAELSKYRFLVAPEGVGIQSSKFLEALVVQTIPITIRFKSFQDLRDYGYPMVVVDSWDEITPESLDRWWAQLSPKLEDSRWLSTVEGQESLLYGTCYDSM